MRSTSLATLLLLAAIGQVAAQNMPAPTGAAAPGMPQASSSTGDTMDRRPDRDAGQIVTDQTKRDLATDPKVLESMNPFPAPQGPLQPNNLKGEASETTRAVDRALENPARLDGSPVGRPSDAAKRK